MLCGVLRGLFRCYILYCFFLCSFRLLLLLWPYLVGWVGFWVCVRAVDCVFDCFGFDMLWRFCLMLVVVGSRLHVWWVCGDGFA